MSIADPIRATVEVGEAFEAVGVRYLVGGSLASSVHGIPRATRDVDVLAEIRPGDVEPLISALARSFHVDVESVREAVRAGSSANVFHKETMFKVDLFVLHDDLGLSELERRASHELLEGRPVWVSSAEDTVLRKLLWFRMGGETSDRQWQDVLGVLRVQADAFDVEYTRRWSAQVGVADLLDRAFAER